MIRLVAGGDLAPVHRLGAVLGGATPELAYGNAIERLRDKDISLVNLESPLTHHGVPAPKSGPNIKAEPRCVEGIRAGGFDMVSLANNHTFDFGMAGYLETRTVLDGAGLTAFGAGRNLEEASRPAHVMVNGESVVVLGFAEHEFEVAGTASAGINPLRPVAAFRQIRALRAQYENIIVMVHGGHEYRALPSPRTVEVYRFLAEAGATMVIGHHPHVVGPYEVHDGVPILYSLGNFLFDWPSPPDSGFFEGIFVEASISRGIVHDFSVEPFVQCADAPGMRLLGDSERAARLAGLERLSGTLADPDAMRELWHDYCSQKRNQYLSHGLHLSRPLRWLLKRNILHRLIGRGAHNRTFLNVLRCESHHELLVAAFEEGLRNPDLATRSDNRPVE